MELKTSGGILWELLSSAKESTDLGPRVRREAGNVDCPREDVVTEQARVQGNDEELRSVKGQHEIE